MLRHRLRDASHPAAARRFIALALLALCALLPSAWLHAQDAIIYRCTDAKGQLTLQNGTPCPAGSRQEIRKIGTLPTTPAAPARPSAPVERPQPPPDSSSFVLVRGPVVEQGPPPDPARVRTAPSPLFECRDPQGERYMSDVETPPKVCVPLNVIGIDGSQELAAGSACEMRTSTCAPVPEAQLCHEWKRRVDEAEFRMRYGSGNLQVRQAEYERLRKIWLSTTCAP